MLDVETVEDPPGAVAVTENLYRLSTFGERSILLSNRVYVIGVLDPGEGLVAVPLDI